MSLIHASIKCSICHLFLNDSNFGTVMVSLPMTNLHLDHVAFSIQSPSGRRVAIKVAPKEDHARVSAKNGFSSSLPPRQTGSLQKKTGLPLTWAQSSGHLYFAYLSLSVSFFYYFISLPTVISIASSVERLLKNSYSIFQESYSIHLTVVWKYTRLRE